MDMLLTAGERISMALLSMALHDAGVPAVSFTGSQTGIITDSSHRAARIKRILGDRVRAALGDKKVAIVAGFQGVSETREITTLGRGGSDTTAVALAAALGAVRCEIYTDVDGVFSADPRVVPEAVRLDRVPHALMAELAVLGAGVLHPRCVELAKSRGVELRVLGSLSDDAGTVIVPEGDVMEDFFVTAVTADKGKTLITVELERATAHAALWSVAAAAHLAVVAPAFAGGVVRFYADKDAEWKRLLGGLVTDGFAKRFTIDDGVAPVSVVGSRFAQDGGALLSVMEALGEAGIQVEQGVASPHAITVGVAAGRVDDAVRVLHKKMVGAVK